MQAAAGGGGCSSSSVCKTDSNQPIEFDKSADTKLMNVCVLPAGMEHEWRCTGGLQPGEALIMVNNSSSSVWTFRHGSLRAGRLTRMSALCAVCKQGCCGVFVALSRVYRDELQQQCRTGTHKSRHRLACSVLELQQLLLQGTCTTRSTFLSGPCAPYHLVSHAREPSVPCMLCPCWG
jgi:hypothetical protein